MDVNSKDSNGNVPLILAAANGHADTVKVLLAHGADVDVKGSEGKNALMRAAEAGSSKTVSLLRRAGAKG
jgi:ankyrin repeat protein